jgi:hypothetical protein
MENRIEDRHKERELYIDIYIDIYIYIEEEEEKKATRAEQEAPCFPDLTPQRGSFFPSPKGKLFPLPKGGKAWRAFGAPSFLCFGTS